jgi:hypothetical protein
VNSRSSSKAAWPERPAPAQGLAVSRRTGSDSPASCANGAQAAPSKVSGTSAGRGGTTRRPNCWAMRWPKSVAPILGIERPPVAITTERADTVPRLVCNS